MNRSASLSTLLPLLLGATAFTPAAFGQFYSVGRPDGEFWQSQAFDLSSDGRVAAGVVGGSSGAFAFTWTAQAGRYEFGREAQFPTLSSATTISGNGQVAAGWARNTGGNFQAYRWSGLGTYQSLGSVGGGWVNSKPTDSNRDGSVIVGTLTGANQGSPSEPFIWTESGGMRSLGRVGGFIWCEAKAVDDSGDMVVGTALAGLIKGWVWTPSRGYQYLSSGMPSDENTEALGISHNAQYIVGTVGSTINGALWTEEGIVNLGHLAGYNQFKALAVDDSGSIVVGNSIDPLHIASVWTRASGVVTLADYLAMQGISLPIGVYLNSCTSISADGNTFAGTASISGQSQSSFGFVVTIPTPASLMPFTVFVFGGRKRRKS